MFARSITFHGRPERIDAGIAFVENEAVPLLDAIKGCRGVSLLVDRASGQCIATSSWDSEATLAASNEQTRPIRERGREILGGSMQVDQWEIAVMRRSQHGESCRVSWLQGDLDTMIETFRVGVLPRLAQVSGFCCASLLVDRAAGVACATSAWETRGAMRGSRDDANELRRRLAGEAGGQVMDVHEYDLAYAHLHVPQMA